VGRNALIVHDFDRPVDVCGYDPKGKVSKSLRTVSAALVYTKPSSSDDVILLVHQAISIPSLSHNLLCPNQLRLNDVLVNETPKCLTAKPAALTHAIQIERGTEDHLPPLSISLSLRGVTSFFPTRKPMVSEYEELPRYELTYEDPIFDPNDPSLAQREASTVDYEGNVVSTGDHGDQEQRRRLFGVATTGSSLSSDVTLSGISVTLVDSEFHRSMIASVRISSLETVKTRTGIDAAKLARNWGIGLERAEKTIQVTTQRGVRTVLHPSLSRRFRTNDRQLRYRRLPIECFTDTMFATAQSWHRQNKCAQVYCTADGWTRAFPIKKRSEAHETLSLLFKRDGVPNVMVMDGALEQTHSEFRRKCREAGTTVRQTEPYTPFSNAAERSIRELKKGVGRQMVKSKSPKVLWDHCLEREAYVRSNTVQDIFQLNGQVPETVVSGETSDITTFAEYEWYEWIKYRDTSIPFPDDRVVLGRDLGPAIDIGPCYTRKILKPNGQVVYRSTVRSLTPDEIKDPEEKKAREAFDTALLLRLGGPATWEDLVMDPEFETPAFHPYEDASGGSFEPKQDEDDLKDAPDTFDQYVGAEVLLPTGDRQATGRVIGRKRDLDGVPRGQANANPILDTRVYTVEFPDGDIGEYAANMIAENMFAQCDSEGNQFLLLDAIVDHRKDGHAVEKPDMYVQRNGRNHIRKTTQGWQLCVKWKDESTTWERLADLKESNPVDVAEYAVAHGIHDEPAFAWWVPHTLKKRNRIIAAMNQRSQKKDTKFGIKIPRTWDQAVSIDKENGDTQWQDAVREEMSKVRIAFKILDDGTKIPPTYQEIGCHLVFDLKIENFRRKARFVAGIQPIPHRLL